MQSKNVVARRVFFPAVAISGLESTQIATPRDRHAGLAMTFRIVFADTSWLPVYQRVLKAIHDLRE